MVRTIIVEEYNDEWPLWFNLLSQRIMDTLGELVISIEHVGSTSVPGLVAKPIIDIDIVIWHKDFSKLSSKLGILGYSHMGDQDIPTREVFKIFDESLRASLPRHHLYACATTSPELRRHLAFRDFLRDHPSSVNHYGELKKRNAIRFPHDIDAYIDAKDDFVKSIIKQALDLGYGNYEFLDS